MGDCSGFHPFPIKPNPLVVGLELTVLGLVPLWVKALVLVCPAAVPSIPPPRCPDLGRAGMLSLAF